MGDWRAPRCAWCMVTTYFVLAGTKRPHISIYLSIQLDVRGDDVVVIALKVLQYSIGQSHLHPTQERKCVPSAHVGRCIIAEAVGLEFRV